MKRNLYIYFFVNGSIILCHVNPYSLTTIIKEYPIFFFNTYLLVNQNIFLKKPRYPSRNVDTMLMG
jgi:hypothetical protein